MRLLPSRFDIDVESDADVVRNASEDTTSGIASVATGVPRGAAKTPRGNPRDVVDPKFWSGRGVFAFGSACTRALRVARVPDFDVSYTDTRFAKEWCNGDTLAETPFDETGAWDGAWCDDAWNGMIKPPMILDAAVTGGLRGPNVEGLFCVAPPRGKGPRA